MTAVDLPDIVARSLPGATPVAVLRLARTEAWRIVRHPVHLGSVVAFVSVTGIGSGVAFEPGRGPLVREGLEFFFTLYYGLIVLGAANLVASSARRGGADPQLDAAPLSGQARTAALCLAVLGPVLIATVAAVVIHALPHDGFGAENAALTPAELLAIPLCVLGAGLLGVAVSRWLPWPGAPLAVAVALVAWVIGGGGQGSWWAPWLTSYSFIEDDALLGSQAWHAVYLAGLSSLATIAALLRHRPHRGALLVAAAGVAAATLAAGIVQLP